MHRTGDKCTQVLVGKCKGKSNLTHITVDMESLLGVTVFVWVGVINSGGTGSSLNYVHTLQRSARTAQ
jgi:hypothetical protein